MTDVSGGQDRLRPGDPLLLRYLYADGSVQAALPMRVVVDEPDLLVGWLAPATPIMYWATADGLDPRSVPLAQRFGTQLTTAPRVWEGPGVLRVMPSGSSYQVIHFWDADGEFIGWYVNLEAPRVRIGSRVDSADWHLDLLISPDRRPQWKDQDEAESALDASHLNLDDYKSARATGLAIIDSLERWPEPIGDWTGFQPDPGWATPDLPPDWATSQR